MSSSTYEQLLREALVDLAEMQELDSESAVRKTGADKKEDHKYFLQRWAAMYLRYVQVARKLDRCHDQILQPQKRQDACVLLDSCLGRMLEMKFRIVEFCGEYVNLDEALVDLKLTPDALEIPIPKYFVEERHGELAARRKFIESLFALHQVEPVEEVNARDAPPEAPMTLENAIEILQCNERGRQGRQRAKFLKSIYEQEQHQAKDFEYGTAMGREEAAKGIQKIVRGFLSRKKVKVMMKEELEFLGMQASEKTASNYQKEKLMRTLKERKMKQQGNIAELGQEAKDMRARIKIQEGGRTMEEMLDEVLLHMANLRLMSKEDVLPEFPTEEEGGSLALLGMLPKQNVADEEAKRKQAEEDAKKKPAGKEAKKSDKELEEEALPVIGPSLFWDRFSNARERYVGVWNQQFQKSYLDAKDFEQRLDKDILRQEIMEGPGGVMSELRMCVDQLVMVEVNNLRERMWRERGGKPRKIKQPKVKKPKLGKDPTEGKKMEEHMSRLVSFGVLQLAKPTKLVEYVGAHNMMGSIMDEYERSQATAQDEIKSKWQTLINNWNEYVEKSLKMNKEQFEVLFKSYCEQTSWSFEPSMLQVRQAVTEYCILPLGSQIVHDLAPHHNSVLLYGAAKSGKSMLTHAVCSESGANLFSLSPTVLNKEGISLPKLVQAVFRVARALAPSVIFIDEVEKVFAGKGKGKKKKKGEAGAGKASKIKKDLIAQMKEIDHTDRVLVVGNSRSPWDAEFKEISAFFKAMICCVHPDYSSRLLLWRTRVVHCGAELKDEEYEVLAYMSNKYSSGTIIKIIDDTLTARRIKRLAQRPVAADEFLPAMSRAQPIFKEDYEAMKEFSRKLPLTARRAKYPQDFEVEETEEEKKANAKKKKK
jgi:SpoVK/Ycf46/Vps4 family AAA+-type ATPase